MACSAVGNFHAAVGSGTNFPMFGGAGLPSRFRMTESRAAGEGLCAIRAAGAGLVIHCRRSTGCFSLQMFRSSHFLVIGVGVCRSCNGDGLRTGLSNRVFGVADGDSSVGGLQRAIRGIGVAGDRSLSPIAVGRIDDHACRVKAVVLGVLCLGGRRSHLDALQRLAAGQNTVGPDGNRGNAQFIRRDSAGIQIFLIDIVSVGYRDHRTLIQALCFVRGSKADGIAGEISLGLSLFEAQKKRGQNYFCGYFVLGVSLHGLHNDIACVSIS